MSQIEWIERKGGVNATDEFRSAHLHISILTLVMKQPKTSPLNVSMASMVFRASPDFASNECIDAPSRSSEYFSQKLLSEQFVGIYFCRAPMMGGVNTCGEHCLSNLCVPMMKNETLLKSTPGATVCSSQVCNRFWAAPLSISSTKRSLGSATIVPRRFSLANREKETQLFHRIQIDLEALPYLSPNEPVKDSNEALRTTRPAK